MNDNQDPYQITPQVPLNEVGVDGEAPLRYAGFWIRLAAFVIDTIVILIITMPLLYAAYGSDYWLSTELIKGPVDVLVSYVFPIVFAVVLWMKIGGTPGKRLLGLKVLDEKTRQYVSAGQGLLRQVGYLVAGLPLFFGLIWVAFDKKKKGFHDHIANTIVVYD